MYEADLGGSDKFAYVFEIEVITMRSKNLRSTLGFCMIVERDADNGGNQL